MLSRCSLAAGAVLLAALSACGGPAKPSSSGASLGNAGVNLGAFAESITASSQPLQFSPGSTAAHVGDIIQWKNVGTVTHTVTFDSNPALSDSGLDPDGTWEVRFNAAGTYPFHCSIHTIMTGTIKVT